MFKFQFLHSLISQVNSVDIYYGVSNTIAIIKMSLFPAKVHATTGYKPSERLSLCISPNSELNLKYASF